MSDDSSLEIKKVGYGRPPTHSRFQKGRSGNPRGRQKGVDNFLTDLLHSLEIPVNVNENGKSKRVSTQKALLLRAREKALKGENRALENLLDLARMHNTPENVTIGGGQQDENGNQMGSKAAHRRGTQRTRPHNDESPRHQLRSTAERHYRLTSVALR
jgi:hypothetical protein